LSEKQATRRRGRGGNSTKPRDPIDVFWERVVKSDGCWGWTGNKLQAGYGTFPVKRQSTLAHRFSYELHVGPIPEGMHIHHRCRNTSCTNPDHLEVVTQAENNRLRSDTRLTPRDVAAIRESDEPSMTLARRYGVVRAHINQIRAGTAWRESAAA
jgi:hypothetical protein